jgi:hypothetical protein
MKKKVPFSLRGGASAATWAELKSKDQNGGSMLMTSSLKDENGLPPFFLARESWKA